ncbi:hypothetical protein [Devosia chinhatensis]|uniref:hypothetical protein n=1 Tax=Devosia chinhatensis TaxID=429727 RepID=UPI000697A43F|nr:hypothetical protein [Devosia chinhatensis]
MTQDPFAADCGKCFALCCTALSFDRGTQFGHDKLAGQPCHFLASDFRCGIHAKRDDLGYEGCETFDCMGAGQRASSVFAGENWQRDPSVARRLFARFSLLMRLQEMRQALATAATLTLDAPLHDEREMLLATIADYAESRVEVIDAGASAALAEARLFLKRLAPGLSG